MAALLRRFICQLLGHRKELAEALSSRQTAAGRARQWTYRPGGDDSILTWVMRIPGEGTAARQSSERAASFLCEPRAANRHVDPLADIRGILQGRQI